LRDLLAYFGVDVAYAEITSPNGHDSFLKDWDQLNPLVSSFLHRVSPPDRLCTGPGGER
jgi:homoserine acetyltransferase